MRSLLVKVVAALVVALAVSTVVTALVASRLTSDALDGQAERNAMSHLSVLQEAYSERESTSRACMAARSARRAAVKVL